MSIHVKYLIVVIIATAAIAIRKGRGWVLITGLALAVVGLLALFDPELPAWLDGL